ncbi:hypothetical protein NC651_036430 [Populus alba x Populus x berolinensis]|nr:hypothetical protein NC651_036430 [Populus alba x Populus x berolinensis]
MNLLHLYTNLKFQGIESANCKLTSLLTYVLWTRVSQSLNFNRKSNAVTGPAAMFLTPYCLLSNTEIF